ncbi:MAG: thermonuclease family protein [Sedimenticola sp.]
MIKHTLLTLTLLLPLTHSGAGNQQLVSLIKVEDGDTLVVNMESKSVRIQLIGIDAPEDVENPKLTKDLQRTALSKPTLMKIGEAATAHLKGLVTAGQKLHLMGDLTKQDRYGRLSALVFKDENHSLNAIMVEDGYAVVLGRYPIDPELKKRLMSREQSAIDRREGLWGSAPETTHAWHGQPK